MSAIPYILPFLVFAVFTYLGSLSGFSPVLTYTLKTVATGGCLLFFWGRFKKEISFRLDLPAIMTGIFIFFIWILLENHYPKLGSSQTAFYPGNLGQDTFIFFLAVRLLGATLVVPVMEELFWRSFALRFLIDTKFTRVPLGTFTWFSFVFVSVAFGLEHHRWLPGILAGLAYSLLLYRSRNLFSPIQSHAVTNFLLGLYVINTGHWQYW